MRPADAHLTPQELESLFFGEGDSKTTTADRAAAQEAQQHLSGCAVCQSVADRYRNADAALKGLGTQKNRASKAPTRGADCPADETWLRLAAGLIKEDEAARYVAHAAQCDWCGPLLKESMEDLTQDVTAEEQEALAKLPSASSGWQREMGKKLAAESGNASSTAAVKDDKPRKRKDKAGFNWWPKLVWAGAGLAVVAAAVGIGIRLTREPDVNQLLAQAYTEQRRIELRIPGAKYGHMWVERGPGALPPVELAEAEALVRRKLEKQPENPSLLQSLGRLELLHLEYKLAIDTLNHALELAPASVSLRIDLASAYFERGEDTGNPSDYNDALELLGQALQKSPDDPVALFNRAILAERTLAYPQALADWEHYLRIRPDDDWSHEARERLDELRKKIGEHEHNAIEPLFDAATFADQLQKEKALGGNAIALRIEEYQQKAIQDWFGKALDRDNLQASGEARSALTALASQMTAQHSDWWLSDMLQEHTVPHFRAGLAFLRDAMILSASDEASRAESEAEKAIQSFESARSVPGVARAVAEKIYAFQMQLKYRECLDESQRLIKVLVARHYGWLESQIQLEQAICANGIEDFNGSERSARKALELARLHAFPTLELRILGTDAFNLFDRGLEQKGLEKTNEGLRRYWQSASPPLRGYQLYWNLFSAAEAKAEWHLATVFGQEAVHEIALTDFKKSEAETRSRLALVAAKAGDFDLARAEASIAEDMIAKVTGSRADPYVVDLKIARAEVELKAGNPAGAIELLNQVRPDLGQMTHYAILLRYYATLGNSALRKNLLEESDSALSEALRIADAAAQSLNTDQERFAWEKATGAAYRAAVELRMVRGDYNAALDLWEKYRSIAVGEPTGVLPASAEHVSDGTAAIVWAILPDGLATWVRTLGNLHAAWTAVDQGSLQSQSRRFAELCATSSTSLAEISSKGHQLYKTLLAPISSHLHDGDLLVVEADGVLAGIPVQVLENEPGKPLIDTHPILYTLSLRHYLESSDAIVRGTIDRNSKAFIVASRTGAGAGGTAVVYNAGKEARAVAAYFAKAVVLEAHKGILEETKRQLPGADVFDFVGHSADMRGQTGLVLWSHGGEEAEIFRPADSTSHRLHLKLAVLSACSTGKPSEDGLLDANGLVRSFLSSGTTAVMATGWSLDSEFAIRYMDLFYTNVTRGDRIPYSLWQASLKIRQQQWYVHPYYWAAFREFA